MQLLVQQTTTCRCSGTCAGYATRTDCPPLIVLAVAAIILDEAPFQPSAAETRTRLSVAP